MLCTSLLLVFMFLSTAVCYCFDLLEPRVFQIALNVQDPTFIASPLSSPVFPPVTPQIGPSMNIPQMGASVPINYYQNYFVGFPQGPTLSELCPHCRATSSTARCLIALLNTPVVHHIHICREQNYLADKLAGITSTNTGMFTTSS